MHDTNPLVSLPVAVQRSTSTRLGDTVHRPAEKTDLEFAGTVFKNGNAAALAR